MSINFRGRIARLLAGFGVGRQPRAAPPPPPTIVKLKNSPALRMEVHARYDQFISAKIARDGEWEPFETELVQRFLGRGDIFVDIGANIGWYTIIGASRVGPTGHVYAFEPAHENLDVAARNVALNGFENVTLERIAIAESAGSASLFLSTENLGDHRLFQAGEARSAEAVQTVTLTDYFADKPGAIRLVKMDTQGSEAKIFEGITVDFARDRSIGAFIFEFWPRGMAESGISADRLISRLRALGMQCYVIQEEYRGVDPIDLDTLEQRAHGDLGPDTDLFANMLALPASAPVPDWLQAFIRTPDAPFFYPKYW